MLFQKITSVFLILIS